MSELRQGFSTGTCAAAAAKAAALALAGIAAEEVELLLPNGELVCIPVHSCKATSAQKAEAVVIKDGGDDVDATQGLAIHAQVEVAEPSQKENREQVTKVHICGGEGVGKVGKPGLQVPPGEPAINPVPRKMIEQAVRSVLPTELIEVTISVPRGKEIAARTFNPRLGIEGGISIIGTSGRVHPKSSEAWFEGLRTQLQVAVAAGHETLFLVPGGVGEAAAIAHFSAPRDAIVQTANFVGKMLAACGECKISRVVMVGHAGKMSKLAAGIFDTHSSVGDARLETIAAWAGAAGASGPLITELLGESTAEATIPLLAEHGLERTWDLIATRAASRAEEYIAEKCRSNKDCSRHIFVDCAITGYETDLVGWSPRLASQFKQRRPTQSPAARLTVVGVGPGPSHWLTPRAWQAISDANVIVGGERHLAEFAHRRENGCSARTIPIGGNLKQVFDEVVAALACDNNKIVIVASGDPECHGVARALRGHLASHASPPVAVEVLPGISAFQMALARLGLAWDEVEFASLHGRPLEALAALVGKKHPLLLLADRKNHPAAIAGWLAERGTFEVVVMERLGYPSERVTRGRAEQVCQDSFDALAVVYVKSESLRLQEEEIYG